MTDDQQDLAEATDPDELGDDPAGDVDFPPERLQGADDPTRDDHIVDSVATRALREEPERGGGADPAEGQRLAAPNDLLDDDVAELTASAIEADDLSAEEAAVHLVDEPPSSRAVD